MIPATGIVGTCGLVRTLLGVTIPTAALQRFFATISTLLRSGKSVADSFQLASTYDAELDLISTAIDGPLRHGTPLTVCLDPFSHRFPYVVLPILAVGEASGNLADSAGRLSEWFRDRSCATNRAHGRTPSAWQYIAMISVLRSALLLFILLATHNYSVIFVVLQMLSTPALTIVNYILGRALNLQFARLRRMRMAVDTIKLALPRTGLVYRNLASAQWCRSFAALWGAGVNVSTALDISASSAMNAYYELALKAAADRTRRGHSLSESLSGIQLVPSCLLSVITASEIAGKLYQSLPSIATTLETEAYDRLEQDQVPLIMLGWLMLASILIASDLGKIASTGV
jgi:type II secretory pathway component PulF